MMNEQSVNSHNQVSEDLKKAYVGFVKPFNRLHTSLGCLTILFIILGITICFRVGWLLGIISTIAVVAIIFYISDRIEASYKKRVNKRISQLEELHGLSHQESFELFDSLKLGSKVVDLKVFVTLVWGDVVSGSAQKKEQIAKSTSDEKTQVPKSESLFEESGEIIPEKITSMVLDSARNCSHNKLYILNNIPEKMAQNARLSCSISSEESLLVLIDCTSFGSAKDCLVCTEYAIYIHNDWSGKTRGMIKIPYSEMRWRIFTDAPSYEINLGNDQFLNTAAAGSKKEIFNFLTKIKTNMIGEVVVGSSNCPRCGSASIERKSELITSTKGHFIGQALFGIVGNIVAGAAFSHKVENCECKSCGCKWVNEKPVTKP